MARGTRVKRGKRVLYKRKTRARKQGGANDLFSAVYEGNIGEVNRLLASGGNPNQRDFTTARHPLLYWAAAKGFLEIVERLIAAGANVNLADEYGHTPLLQAAISKHQQIAERLLAAGANVNAAEETGLTPLMMTANYNSIDMARLLLSAGADASLKNKSGRTARAIAEIRGYTEMRDLLAQAEQTRAFVLPAMNVPAGAENTITYQQIQEGNTMVNFMNEREHDRYYKKETFNSFPEPKMHPYTRVPITPANVQQYTARLVGGTRRRKTFLRK